MGHKGYTVRTMDELTTGYCRCVTVNTARQTHSLYWFSFSRVPTGRTDFHLLTNIIVVKHYWAVLFFTFVSYSSDRDTVYYVHVTAQPGLSLNTVATTIRGYCGHFTAQWRESAAHASGHKHGEALTHTNKPMHAYVNTCTQKWTHLLEIKVPKLCWCKLNMPRLSTSFYRIMIHILPIASVVWVGQRYFICGERSPLELLNIFNSIGCVLCTLCMQGSMHVYSVILQRSQSLL